MIPRTVEPKTREQLQRLVSRDHVTAGVDECLELVAEPGDGDAAVLDDAQVLWRGARRVQRRLPGSAPALREAAEL